MKRAYKYKIKPTMKQQRQLSQFFGCARFIYNWGLDRKISEYNESKKTLTYIQLAKELTLLKQTEEHTWLNNCANECLHPQSLVAIENKVPQGSGTMGGEGKVIGLPMKRQDSKSCNPSGTTGI